MASDELTLLVRAPASTLAARQGTPAASWVAYTGWTELEVQRSVENFPSAFSVSLTSKGPGGAANVAIAPGYECQIKLGNDLVLTGYVDRFAPSLNPREHVIQVQGRSKGEDLVDCAAEFATFQLNTTNALAIAQIVAAPFGVAVNQIGDIDHAVIPQFGVILSESPYDIIERVGRYAAVLIYDDVNGNLVISRAGSTKMASGFSQGQNIQAAQAVFSLEECFSQIDVTYMSTDTLLTGVPGADTPADAIAADLVTNASATDPNVPRYRPLLIIADQNDLQYLVSQQQARWEVARRFGRSRSVQITVDSWRDKAGSLWQLNSLASVDLPAFGLSNVMWLITEVTFRRAVGTGTTADLVLMPPEGMLPEPIVLVPFDPAVAQALLQNSGAAKAAGSESLNLPAAVPLSPFNGAQ